MTMRILGTSFALAFYCTTAFAGTVAPSAVTPVQAELVASLHGRLLKVGSTVYARVTVDWQQPECVLDSGAILEAQVVSVAPHTKTTKDSELGLAFTKAQCGGPKMNPFGLMLAAMAAPPGDDGQDALEQSLPILSSAAGAGAAAFTSMHNTNNAALQVKLQIQEFPVIPNMKMGYVAGLRGLTLSVGKGPENSSLLTSKNHDITLDKNTMLLLVPTKGTFPAKAVASAAGPSSPVAPGVSGSDASGGDASAAGVALAPPVQPAQPALDEIDRCAPPQCSVALPAADAIDNGNAAASMSIRNLGYSPRPQRQTDRFDNDDALAYLGPRELLVAFNPHILVTRHFLGRSGSTMRIIRAALVDTESHRVTRTVDWELPDERQYLWPLSDGRALVHVGSELRVYSKGLKVQNRISLDGPLAFVRVTPDGSYVALGILHERHSSELHAKLVDNLGGGEPQEDVHILVLNRNFEVIAKSNSQSGLMAPTLLNEGQAKLKAQPGKVYRIALQTWDNRAQTVARFKSGCTPELTSIAPDLIFLVSCDAFTDGREYRVLRPDGKVVLKGDSTLNEAGHAAEGSADQKAFAVKIVVSSQPLPPGALFSAADFSSEELRVYRATDGKRLLGVRLPAPSSSSDGFALAPDGSQLAVLTLDQLAIYAVPAN
jgi:hypothetical protein